MKTALILTLSLVAAALLFPIRTGVVTQSYGVVEVPMGPYFVASAPSKQDIAEAFLGRELTGKQMNQERVTSRVDLSRTLLFAGGALAAAIAINAVLRIARTNRICCRMTVSSGPVLGPRAKRQKRPV